MGIAEKVEKYISWEMTPTSQQECRGILESV